jgi:hypothetical protein
MDVEEIKPLLLNIGIIAEDKTIEFGPEDDDVDGNASGKSWNYEKRFIRRVGGRVVQHFELMFPPIAPLLKWPSEYHTVHETDDEQLIKKARHSLTSLWLMCEETFVSVNRVEREFLNTFARMLYTGMRITMGRGWSSLKGSAFFKMHVKLLMSAPLGYRYFDHWFWSIRGIMRLPIPLGYVSFPTPEEYEPRVGVPYIVKSHPLLQTLRKLGWCILEQRYELVDVDYSVYSRLEDFFYSRTVPSYDFVLLETFPSELMSSFHTVFANPSNTSLAIDSGTSVSSDTSDAE